jgi:hypothetical protein
VTLRELGRKTLDLIAAIIGMIALPTLCLTMRSTGPAAHVVYYAYLPLEELTIVLSGAVLGASLAVHAMRRLRGSPLTAARGLPRWRLAGLGLLLGWIGQAQLSAFPAAASVMERDAWARAHVPQYGALKRVIASLPEVHRDVGDIVLMAPTASDEHRFAREMSGDDMMFSLEVIGQRGRGVFYADCTLDQWRVYEWRSGRWVAKGHEQRIEQVSERVPSARAARPQPSAALHAAL